GAAWARVCRRRPGGPGRGLYGGQGTARPSAIWRTGVGHRHGPAQHLERWRRERPPARRGARPGARPGLVPPPHPPPHPGSIRKKGGGQPMNAIQSVIVMQARDRMSWLVIPAGVLATGFAIVWLIALFIHVLWRPNDETFTGALAVFYVVMLVESIRTAVD